jgi:hypothetical protein
MTQEMDSFVAASRPIIALLQPYNSYVIGFHAVLLLFQQSRPYPGLRIFALF